MRSPSLGFLLFLGLLFSPAAMRAQGLGSAALFGEVTNEAGDAVASAQITVRYVPTGTLARTITDEDGRYQFVNLRSGGPYNVTVSTLGYADIEREDVHLRAEQRLRMDFEVSEEAIELAGLEVTATPDLRFEVTRNAPALTITQEIIEAHPTIERNFMELAALSPMAVKTSDEGGYSISGQNERHNAILIDGSLSQDVFGSSSSGMPGAKARAKPIPMDAIQEFRLEVAPFDARSSGFTGGVMNAITKSGTNEWRASAFSQQRDERLFGNLLLDGANVAPEEYEKRIWGFTLGGPIQRDRAHVFVAAEFEERTEPAPGFSLGVHDPVRIGIAADSLSRMSTILNAGYGAYAGTPGQVSLANPLANVFTRLDWRLSDDHTLTLRHNYAGAARDSTPNRAPFGVYEFSSAGYRIESSNHTFTGRLVSRLAGGHSNELTVNLQRITERSEPASAFPQIDVRISSDFGDLGLARTARAGSRYFSQRSVLDQDILQLNEALTLARDDVITTIGVGLDVFNFFQDFRPGSLGYYRFNALADLEANQPNYYEVNLLRPYARDPTVRFGVLQPSAYFQNEHTFPDGLVLRYGVRLDVPTFPSSPEYNPAIEEAFEVRTDRLPSGPLLFSPRFGFNWQSDLEYRTQVRGGFGLFTGRLPFVWMADAYRYTGIRSALLACEGAAVPVFDPHGPPPVACADGRGVAEAEHEPVVAFDPDFVYPRELKVTTSIDQVLPGGVVVAVEGMFVQTHGRTFLRDLNISRPAAPRDDDYGQAFGDFRAHYGDPTPYGYEPRRRFEDFSHVLVLENEKRSAIAYALNFNLDKRFSDWLHLSGSFATARSDDKQSLIFPNMLANLGATPIGELATQPLPARSNFDRPWKTVVSARTALPQRLGGTQLSVSYVGQSGTPYSYVYGQDINGDGFSGPGIPLDASNDLVFVPEVPTRIPASIGAKSMFAQFVSSVESCLADVRGEIARRNSCRTPDVHRLDLRLVQPIQVRGMRFEVMGDLLNVLNLLDAERGLVWEVDPVVPLLEIVDRAETDFFGVPIPTSRPTLGYTGGVRRDPVTGEVGPTLPYKLITPASQWQAQIGLRVSF